MLTHYCFVTCLSLTSTCCAYQNSSIIFQILGPNTQLYKFINHAVQRLISPLLTNITYMNYETLSLGLITKPTFILKIVILASFGTCTEHNRQTWLCNQNSDELIKFTMRQFFGMQIEANMKEDKVALCLRMEKFMSKIPRTHHNNMQRNQKKT